MEISVQQKDLHQGLNMVNRAVPTKSPRPLLTNICLATDDGRLRLYATDEEMGIVCWIPATIHEAGTAAVPAKVLCDFVGNLQPGVVNLIVKADEQYATQTITVKSQSSRANIRGFDATEFPLLPGIDGAEPPILLDALPLKTMVGEVIDSAGNDLRWPVFTGVLVQVKNQRLTLVTADRNRLAIRKEALLGEVRERKDVIIPAQTLALLASILPAQGKVEMAVTARGSQVIFRAEDLLLSSRLIEGAYPNYEQIIPKEHVSRAVVSTKDFADKVKEVLTFAVGGGHVVSLSLSGGGEESLSPGKLTLAATAQDLGDGISILQATLDGPDQQVIYDIRYLVDALKGIKTPEVAIELTSDRSPAIIRPIGAVDLTYIITPMTRNATPLPAKDKVAVAS